MNELDFKKEFIKVSINITDIAKETLTHIENNRIPLDMYEDFHGNPVIKKTSYNVEQFLNALNVKTYYDLIKRKEVLAFNDDTKDEVKRILSAESTETLVNMLIDIFSSINWKDLKSFKKNELQNCINLITKKNKRNIPLEKLQTLPALKLDDDKYLADVIIKDGNMKETNRFLNCIKYKTTLEENQTELYNTLIIKWINSVVAMLHNQHGLYGADGVLCLLGKQGIGKTQFGHKLSSFFGNDYFLEGLTLNGSKDDEIKATSSVIAELGEFKADKKTVEYMKNFITASADTFRLPYATRENTNPRLSSYYITTNNEDFLLDTENRRFWVVPVEDFDLNELDKIDYRLLWAEALDRYDQDQNCFRLTPEEQKQVINNAENYRNISPEQQAIIDMFNWDIDRRYWSYKSPTAIAKLADLPTINNRYVGKALTAMGYDENETITAGYHKKRTSKGLVYFTPPLKEYAQLRNEKEKEANGYE